MRKYYLKNTHGLMSTKLCDSPHQATDLVESKIYKSLSPKLERKLNKNVCSIFFKNKSVEFINIACILQDPEIAKSLPTSTVKFPLPMVVYLTNPDSLQCKFNK